MPRASFLLLPLLLLPACTPRINPLPSTQPDQQEALLIGTHNEAIWNHDLPLLNPALLAAAQAHEKLLLTQPDYHPAPRFTQTLALTDTPTLQLSRQQLLTQIQRQLAPLQHIHREPSSPGAPDDSTETLAASESRISRCDLLNLLLLLPWLAQPDTTAQILSLGTADRADTSSEHGGLLAPPNPPTSPFSLELTPMQPLFTGSDLAYITSDATLERVPTSLALFHLHFHQLDNTENAGPGMGDLRFAHLNRTTCLVFTSLSQTSFNADYYNPDGAIIDLGVYHLNN